MDQQSLFSVAGRHCLITGGGRGLGRHMAGLLVRNGAHVTVLSLSRATGKETAVAGAVMHECDVTDTQRTRALLSEIHAERPVDLLINNAGRAPDPKGDPYDADALSAVFALNVIAASALASAMAGHWLDDKRAGTIIYISSVLAASTFPRLAGYGASKAALEHVVRQQAVQWGRHGIRVNALAPGWIETDMTRHFLQGSFGSVIRGSTPMRRLGALDDLDGPLLFLASDASRFVTGQVLCADGGLRAAAG